MSSKIVQQVERPPRRNNLTGKDYDDSAPHAVSPEAFADRVVALARDRFPLLECQQEEDFCLRLGSSQVNLHNFYRTYQKTPERFEEIVLPALTAAVRVQEWGEAQAEPPLDDVADRIMPMLYPEDAWQESFESFVSAPWVGGLVIAYVVDDADTYWYVGRSLLERWEISEEELHERALRNLDLYFEEKPMEYMVAGEEDDPSLLMPGRADAYNSVRLLSERFHVKLRGLFGPQCVVGIPNRDFLIAVSLSCGETLEQIRDKVRDDHATMDHALCERLLLVSADGVSEYFDDSM